MFGSFGGIGFENIDNFEMGADVEKVDIVRVIHEHLSWLVGENIFYFCGEAIGDVHFLVGSQVRKHDSFFVLAHWKV